jgi:3-hydroxyisobutyrate dehydrogenase-like beta-hydroxyacid dehydrogenase
MSGRPIGLIGVGLVGTALAERWQHAGWKVTGFDIDPQFRSRLEAVGGTAAASVLDVIAKNDIIALSLPNSTISAALIHEWLPALNGKTVIDTTTGEPAEMAALGQTLSEHGADYLDATIAGSSTQIRNGEVLVMIGGEAEIATACQDVFTPFAASIFHMGAWGTGAEMKLVVNLALGLHRAVLAEALSFAERLGIDPRRALEVLQASPAASRVMQTKGEKMLASDFTPQARLSQHYKDVRLILAAGAAVGARLPLSQLHATLLAEREAAGDGNLDNSAIIRAFLPDRG